MEEKLLIIDIIGIVITSLFIILFLFIKHPNRKAQKVLLTGFILAVIGTLFELVRELELREAAQILFPVYLTLIFVHYPILYIYIKLIIWENKPESRSKLLSHFMLPLFILVMLLVFYIPLPEDNKISFLNYTTGEIPPGQTDAYIITTIIIFYYLQAVFYSVLLAKTALHLHQAIKTHIIIKEEYLPLWTWIVVFAIYSYEIIGSVIIFSFDISYESANFWINILFNVFIIIIGLFGLKQYEFSVQTKLKQLARYFEDENGAKKTSERLTTEQKQNIAKTLEKYVTEKKFYLDPNLKIEQLAKKIHVPYKNLSLVINELLGKNFTTLLNEYRVEEARRIIAENIDIESLEDVYTRVGFNSRSTFNRVFKTFTGLTPSEYRESLYNAA